MSEYGRVLNTWAKEKIHNYYDDVEVEEVTFVKFEYDEGFRYSSYTFEDPSFKVRVHYREKGASRDYVRLFDNEECETMGQLLTELFQIAAREGGNA